MEATEAILGMFRAFPDLTPTAGGAEPTPIGFVSRAWRPVSLTHAPVSGSVAADRILAGPAWAGSVPSARGA